MSKMAKHQYNLMIVSSPKHLEFMPASADLSGHSFDITHYIELTAFQTLSSYILKFRLDFNYKLNNKTIHPCANSLNISSALTRSHVMPNIVP